VTQHYSGLKPGQIGSGVLIALAPTTRFADPATVDAVDFHPEGIHLGASSPLRMDKGRLGKTFHT
jgi:hypothetical protein